MTLSCANSRWDELPYMINKLNNLGFSDNELKNLSYQERTKLLNENQVLVARHFQYKVQVFFKELILDGPLGKTKYYALHNEFQERGSPHVHAFIWILDAPKIENKFAYLAFVENSIGASLPDPQNEPEMFALVKTFQIHSHSRTCWKYKKNKCRFSYGRFFSDRTIISKPLDDSLSSEQKSEKMNWRRTVLGKVKEYINDKLYPAKVNVIDPSRENYQAPPTIKEILLELSISSEEYYQALSISEDNDYELHLIRPPNSCFVNNYFSDGLKAWQANMDIQPVFNEYKAVTYMCSYFSKSEDQCSAALKQAAKEALDNKLGHFDIMKNTIQSIQVNENAQFKRKCTIFCQSCIFAGFSLQFIL